MTIMEHPAQSIMTLENAMMLAAKLQSEGQLAQAEELLQRIIQVNPAHAHALHLLGVIAHQGGNTALGIQLIQKAIVHEPKIALFHSNIGEMYRQLHNIDLSIEHGEIAVNLDPNSALALSNLGIAYYDAKQYDQAERCQKHALALDPTQCNALNNMGSIYKERKNMQEAMRFYQAAIASSPNFADSLNNLGAILVIEQQFSQALQYLKRAIVLTPNSVDANCNLGFAFNGLENVDIALCHFQRALELNPQHAEAYLGISMVYCTKLDFEAAENYVRQALELEPNKAEFYQFLAMIYCNLNDSTQALAYFDHALSLEPTLSSAFIGKGNLLAEMGKMDEADAILSQAQMDPSTATQLSLHYSLVQLHTVKPQDSSMQALLSIASNVADLTPQQQEYLYFALGKCYDDIGEWATAFEHFTKGCQIKRSNSTYSTEEQNKLTQRIIDCFTEKTLETLRQSANPSTAPIFVLGMPRSGTTLIEQIIASHPSVYGAGELTHLTQIISRPIDTPAGTLVYPENILHLTHAEARAISDEYLSHLQSYAPTAAHISDKMPGNFVAIGLIHALFPEAKIIHVERNPIDTCLSCYTKRFTHGQLFSYDLTELGHFYASYQRIMAHWRQLLPANSWLDVCYEDVVIDLESEARRLITYCGLPWDPSCLAFHSAQRQVRTASYMQIRKPIYKSSVDRWRRYERELMPLMQALNDNLPLI